MKRRRKQPVEPQVVASWHGRSAALQQRLDEAPAAGEAWFWQIQCNIIHYLLERYAGHEIQPASNPVGEGAALNLQQEMNHTPMEVRPSDSFTADAGSGSWPRASEKIRPVLQSIADVNQVRYELLQRLRIERLEALRREREQMQNAMRAYVKYEDSFEPITETCAEAGMLSEKVIADILSGKLVVDPLPADWDPLSSGGE